MSELSVDRLLSDAREHTCGLSYFGTAFDEQLTAADVRSTQRRPLSLLARLRTEISRTLDVTRMSELSFERLLSDARERAGGLSDFGTSFDAQLTAVAVRSTRRVLGLLARLRSGAGRMLDAECGERVV